MRKEDITIELASCLVGEQFPQWAELEIETVELDGWDNTTFRLGDDLTLRLPSGEEYVAQIDKEHRWLPVLAPHLPVPVPTPVAKGEPGCGFPRPWSVYRWLDGRPAALTPDLDLDRLADDVVDFVTALHAVPVDGGPAAGPHSHDRGGPVTVFDEQTRAAIDALTGHIDTGAAREVWERAATSTWTGSDVWVHGDLVPSNLLVDDGHLAGVIDFGCSAVGDPACDLVMAWTVFEGTSRDRFMAGIAVDDDTWDRARGWALWKAVIDPARDGHRFGWRWNARGVIDQVVAEFAEAG